MNWKDKLPDMHLSGPQPQWETIPVEDWNEHQIRAYDTNGWDTPGNRETLKGAIYTLGGLALLSYDNVWTSATGVVAVGWGRYKDITDGKIAAATKTKSPLGEKVDAITDNILMASALGTLWAKDIVPTKEAIALTSLVLAKTAATTAAKLLKREIHVTRAAKLGAVAAWAGIGLHAMARTINYEAPKVGHTVNTVGSAANWVGIGLWTIATAAYVKRAATPNEYQGDNQA